MSAKKTSTVQGLSWSRRRLLKGSLVLCAAPLLNNLATNILRAQEGVFPLRFMYMFTGNCHNQNHFIPSNTNETAFSFSTAITPLEAHRAEILLLHGIEGTGSHHQGTSEALTGRPSSGTNGGATGGPSLDQFFADRFRSTSALASLELGVAPGNRLEDQITFSPSGLPLPALGSPRGAFDKLFRLANEDPATAELRRARKRSVLDAVAADLQSLQGKLGASTRTLLDEHLTLVRQQEQTLSEPAVQVQCDLPTAPSGTGLLATFQGHNANIANAFRCGLTRVVTLRVGGYGGIESGSYSEVGIDNGHHSAAHTGPDEDLAGINRFHATQFADLITRLQAIPEGDGTVLDNTVMVWATELGIGNYTHARNDMPYVVAGGKNAGVARGRYRRVNGRTHDVLLSLAHVMGQTDITSFGDSGTQLVEQLWI